MPSDRIKRIGALNRRVIVPRTKRGPKASVYGDNVKRYSAGEHPTEEEKESIEKAEDTTNKSIHDEAGLSGKKYSAGERSSKKDEVVSGDEYTKQSVNDIAGVGGKKSAAGERPVEDDEGTPKDAVGDEDPKEPVDAEEEGPENVSTKQSSKAYIPPDKVMTEFVESLTIAKIKEFAEMNELDLGDARLKADYVECVTRQVIDRLPDTVMGHLDDLDFGEYILYLIDASGLEAKEEWLPKQS